MMTLINAGILYIYNSIAVVTVLHNFSSSIQPWGVGSDGYTPQASPIVISGSIYGVTLNGGLGTTSAGVLYSCTTAGAGYQILHYFHLFCVLVLNV